MIHLELEIDDIDYDALLDLLLPLAAERMSSPESSLSSLFSGSDPTAMAKKLLKVLPQSGRDKMAAELINGNSAKLCEKLEILAQTQGLSGRIKSISASTKP